MRVYIGARVAAGAWATILGGFMDECERGARKFVFQDTRK